MTATAEKNGQYLAKLTEQTQPDQSGAAWIYPLCKDAGARFQEVGFPQRDEEDWRFTNITPLVEADLHLAGAATVPAQALQGLLFDEIGGTRLVFVNGRYAPEHSRIEATTGLHASSLADALRSNAALVEPHLARHASVEANPFVALNTASIRDGAFIHISHGAVIEQPIHLLYYSTEAHGATHPRTLVVAGENSQCTLLESYAGAAGEVYFTNAVTEVIMQPSSMLDHYKLQQESRAAFHVATLQVQLQQSSTFSTHAITLGGSLVRNDSNAVFAGERAECTLNGLYTANGQQLIDNHTSIDHALPNCNSHEIYKGILDDAAKGVFNGKIFVHQDAQKTDAKQTNQTILLSPNAQINTKPQLEIYADDVKCTHGATIGQLSSEALFYLRSRGIPRAQAQSLLTYAFAADISSRIRIEALKDQVNAALLEQRQLETD